MSRWRCWGSALIEHVTRATAAGVMYCPRLVCVACGVKIERAIDGYVFVTELLTEASFVHKRCLPDVMEADPDIVAEEASIFFHRLLHNSGEPVAAESISLIRECRAIAEDYDD